MFRYITICVPKIIIFPNRASRPEIRRSNGTEEIKKPNNS
jgi:hypothetical protein